MTVFLPFSPSYGFIMLYSVAQYRSYNGLWKPTSAYSHLKYWMISRGSYGTYRGMWRWVRDGEGAERGCSWSAERGNAPVFRPSEVKSCYLVSRHESPTLCSPDHQINLSASFQLHLAVCHTLNTSKHIIQTTFWSNNLCPQSILQPCHPIQKTRDSYCRRLRSYNMLEGANYNGCDNDPDYSPWWRDAIKNLPDSTLSTLS